MISFPITGILTMLVLIVLLGVGNAMLWRFNKQYHEIAQRAIQQIRVETKVVEAAIQHNVNLGVRIALALDTLSKIAEMGGPAGAMAQQCMDAIAPKGLEMVDAEEDEDASLQ